MAPTGRTAPSPTTPPPTGLDTRQHYSLDPEVVLRPEPFGALAYHPASRRLTFLRSPQLVGLVKALDDCGSLEQALQHAGIEPSRRAGYVSALARLARSGLIRAD